jgi:hypothetical protein
MRSRRTALVAAMALAAGCQHTSAAGTASTGGTARTGATTTTRLRKADVGPAVHTVIPRLATCYERARAHDPQLSGVINTKLTVENEPQRGMRLRVIGFDTSGPLGESQDFLACVKRTYESAVLPALTTRGALDFIYPSTFAPQPPDNHDTSSVDEAARAASEGRWADARRDAERGLELTSLDGTYRRRLIEIAGLAACHLHDEVGARFYFALAPPRAEPTLQQACQDAANIDLSR